MKVDFHSFIHLKVYVTFNLYFSIPQYSYTPSYLSDSKSTISQACKCSDQHGVIIFIAAQRQDSIMEEQLPQLLPVKQQHYRNTNIKMFA